MSEWDARISRTTKVGTRINLEMMTATVDAESEAEAREILAEEMEDWTIDTVKPAQQAEPAGKDA